MRYEIFVTLWGEKFVKKFLDFALSSQLTPGNLPGLFKEAHILYRIYTDRASEPFFWPGLHRQVFCEVFSPPASFSCCDFQAQWCRSRWWNPLWA